MTEGAGQGGSSRASPGNPFVSRSGSLSAVTEHNGSGLRRTPLHAIHVARGARMMPFAGYDMPVQYKSGILDEHLHTRAAAGLFDVSHMGQAMLLGVNHAAVAEALETLTPAGIVSLVPGRSRYALLTNDGGGTIDDLMVTRPDGDTQDGILRLVVNAGRKDIDYKHFADRLPRGIEIIPVPDRALIALQGPEAANVLARHCEEAGRLRFMHAVACRFNGMECFVSRSGYTGEDGFEISIPSAYAEAVAEILLAEPEVKLVGLGARDMLRLEAGLCLYGHELDETLSPIEAALDWTIPERRRKEGGFLGAERILRELRDGSFNRRVGLRPSGRTLAREGTNIFDRDGAPIGVVTSGGYGASAGGPVSMGYVARDHASVGTHVVLVIRGRASDAEIVPLPFVPHRTAR